jgi:hypothetical protein
LIDVVFTGFYEVYDSPRRRSRRSRIGLARPISAKELQQTAPGAESVWREKRARPALVRTRTDFPSGDVVRSLGVFRVKRHALQPRPIRCSREPIAANISHRSLFGLSTQRLAIQSFRFTNNDELGQRITEPKSLLSDRRVGQRERHGAAGSIMQPLAPLFSARRTAPFGAAAWIRIGREESRQ